MNVVIYYSKSGVTEKLAKRISEDLKCDIIKILPKKEYGNYISAVSRVAVEKITRKQPEFINDIPDLSKYDTVFFGYPIWYSAPPQVAINFMKKCDLSGKKLVPFSTSGGLSISVTLDKVKKINEKAIVTSPYNCSMIQKDDYQKWIAQFENDKNE